MEVAREEVWWADLPDAADSSPAGTRPVLVIQSKAFNRSRIQTATMDAVSEGLRIALEL